MTNMRCSAPHEEQPDQDIKAAITPLIHEIQNHLQIITLEFELLGDKSAELKHVVYALKGMTRSVRELQSISRRLPPRVPLKSPARHDELLGNKDPIAADSASLLGTDSDSGRLNRPGKTEELLTRPADGGHSFQFRIRSEVK